MINLVNSLLKPTEWFVSRRWVIWVAFPYLSSAVEPRFTGKNMTLEEVDDNFRECLGKNYRYSVGPLVNFCPVSTDLNRIALCSYDEWLCVVRVVGCDAEASAYGFPHHLALIRMPSWKNQKFLTLCGSVFVVVSSKPPFKHWVAHICILSRLFVLVIWRWVEFVFRKPETELLVISNFSAISLPAKYCRKGLGWRIRSLEFDLKFIVVWFKWWIT